MGPIILSIACFTWWRYKRTSLERNLYWIQSGDCLVRSKIIRIAKRVNVKAKLFIIFVVPKENVATIELSACVTEGVSRCRNALINGMQKVFSPSKLKFIVCLKQGKLVDTTGTAVTLVTNWEVELS